MATSKPPGQPLAKAATQLADINVVSDQTEAGSIVPTKCAPTKTIDENRDISSNTRFRQEIYSNAVAPETSHSASRKDSVLWDKKAVLGLGMFSSFLGIQDTEHMHVINSQFSP